MCPNYHGSTLTSRFLLAALPKSLYTGKNEEVFTDLLGFLADEINYMFYTGVHDGLRGRGKFYAAMISVCGDWPWLADSGFFERSYRCVMKKKNQRKTTGICHLCAAGKDCDFEEINTLTPEWLGTMYTLGLSHADADESPLVTVPHVPGQLAQLWSYDLFHTMHLGVCKAFLGSALALLSEYQPETSVDLRFQSLTDLYLCWTHQNGHRPWVQKLTKELLGWTSTTMYPNGTWHKGALWTTLMTWVESRFDAEGHLWDPVLQQVGETCKLCNAFLRSLYDEDAWLEAARAKEIALLGHQFLVRYSRLAYAAHREGRLLWVVQPKLHAMHHLVLYLYYSSRNGKTLNVLCYATQADEDFIGRPSRLSRRVTPKPLHSCHRVLERHLQGCYTQWVKEGYIIPTSSSAAGRWYNYINGNYIWYINWLYKFTTLCTDVPVFSQGWGRSWQEDGDFHQVELKKTTSVMQRVDSGYEVNIQNLGFVL